jgi:mannosyl-3-phosphoglycerate phosphatase
MKIVFTDLDGTLLDHFTYSYQESLEGINLLREKNIPLIMVSSKTFAEMKKLSEELKLDEPFIFENGAGVAFPGQHDFKVELLGLPVEELDKKMQFLSGEISQGIKTFSEMDENEVSERTGLSLERAKLAKERLGSLPFIIEGEKQLDEIELFEINKKIKDQGVTITKGGRFYHFISDQTSKGNAVKYLSKHLKEYENSEELKTMGVGDSLNDAPLLEVVDYPFAVRKHDNSHLNVDFEVSITDGIGPVGFSEAVKDFIQK